MQDVIYLAGNILMQNLKVRGKETAQEGSCVDNLMTNSKLFSLYLAFVWGFTYSRNRLLLEIRKNNFKHGRYHVFPTKSS